MPDAAGAVEFWDLTNKQDWAACESVQRGLASPHFAPGPFAPNEDAVAQLVSMIGRAYRTGPAGPVTVRPVRRLTLWPWSSRWPAPCSPSVGTRPAPAAPPSAAEGDVQVGDLTLKPCKVVRRALCGKIRRAWEPGNPSAGTVKVGFAFVPARRQPAIDTLVPHEGGPGYSTTGTGADYAAMYGPLLDRRNLLLVDQRGTGLSQPLRCPDLQNLVLPYNVAARALRSLAR